MAKKKALTKKGQMRGCFDDTSIPLLYTKCKSFSVIYLTIFYFFLGAAAQ